MTKYEIELLITRKYPSLSKTDAKILEEFAQAVDYRLKVERQEFTEQQCLNSWVAYREERFSVYSALESSHMKPRELK
jgi:hypothetical protein